MSEGCAGSFDKYVSLKSRYLMSMPFMNAANSGEVAPPPMIADDGPSFIEGATPKAAFTGKAP